MNTDLITVKITHTKGIMPRSVIADSK
ncbi:uncharacterized protein METZ01_LOCUS71227 [marine metagenome]|uniref:Uncharacterized protein n=1 Tax=marine metagenome TaxID=408172 RepID=A0A381TW81_9ZZZZ